MSIATQRAAVIAAVQREMIKAVRTNPPASAAVIRPFIQIPDGVNPSIIGVAIRELKRAGLIVEVGTVTASHKGSHGHLMKTWKLAEPQAGQSAAPK